MISKHSHLDGKNLVPRKLVFVNLLKPIKYAKEEYWAIVQDDKYCHFTAQVSKDGWYVKAGEKYDTFLNALLITWINNMKCRNSISFAISVKLMSVKKMWSNCFKKLLLLVL